MTSDGIQRVPPWKQFVPAYEGQGYATEVALGLVAYAVEGGLARTIRTHTMPEPNASTRVLEKCSFQCLGEVIDHEDGRVWRWEHHPVRTQTLI